MMATDRHQTACLSYMYFIYITSLLIVVVVAASQRAVSSSRRSLEYGQQVETAEPSAVLCTYARPRSLCSSLPDHSAEHSATPLVPNGIHIL